MNIAEAEQILGVTRDASESQIKAAFRKQAKESHPDQSDDPKATKSFQRLERARRRLLEGETKTSRQRTGSQSETDDGSSSGSRSTNHSYSSQADSATSDTEREERETRDGGTDSQPHQTGAETEQAGRRRSRDTRQASSQTQHRTHEKTEYTQRGRSEESKSEPASDGSADHPSRTRQALPVLAAFFVGFVVFLGFGLTPFSSIATVLSAATQYLVTRAWVESASVDVFKNRSSTYSHTTYEGRTVFWPVILLVGCATLLFGLGTMTGTEFGGIGTLLITFGSWVVLTIGLAVLFYVISTTLLGGLPGILIVTVAGLVTLAWGFTTWIGPVAFGTFEGAYFLFNSYTLIGVDVGLAANLGFSAGLILLTLMSFVHSSGMLAQLVRTDCQNGSTVWPSVWLSSPFSLFICFLLVVPSVLDWTLPDGSSVGYFALSVAVLIATPALALTVYLFRRRLEPLRHSESESNGRGGTGESA
jgi:curved DNA-binding protein CbpA